MDEAIVYAKRKISMFPDVYADYLTDMELFKLLVEDCRKQLEAEKMSLSFLKSLGGAARGKSAI